MKMTLGVPTVAYWVKNVTAAAEVTTVTPVHSLPYAADMAIKKKMRKKSDYIIVNSTSSEEQVLLVYILTNIWYCQFLIF